MVHTLTWKMNGHFTVCCPLVSAIVCEDPTLANGVTVLEPHSNAVNSEIFYQCEESGLVPSSNSSLCEEDGMWSPDTSQVRCVTITANTSSSSTTTGKCTLFMISTQVCTVKKETEHLIQNFPLYMVDYAWAIFKNGVHNIYTFPALSFQRWRYIVAQ